MNENYWYEKYMKSDATASFQYELLKKKDEEIKQYRNEIVELRGKAHLSCPACYDDCTVWVVDGKPCSDNWKL